MLLQLPRITPLFPEIFVLFMIAVVLLAGLFAKPRIAGRLTYLLTQTTLMGACILTFRFYDTETITTFNGMFIHDPLSQVSTLFVYVTTVFTLAYARQYIEERSIQQPEYYILTLFSVLGMMALISAGNFLSLYVSLELFSLPLYAMVALRRDLAAGSEAAMKYFITGAVASGMLLYGISMLFGTTNSLDLNVVASTTITLNPTMVIIYRFALVFIIAGVIFKLGAVPFHMWVPDVYQGAPTSVTLFISGAPKIAALALLFRLLTTALPSLHLQWTPILIAISITSMALGNLVAIVQTDLKRMLAYSSIAHMGYTLLGILTAGAVGYSAGLFYMISYSIMAVGAFGLLTLMSRAGVEVDKVGDLRGLNARNPWLALMMLFLMFSMAGLPPTVGFFAKLGVLQALIDAHLVWLAVLALIFAIIGAYYYIRVVKVMYFEEPDSQQLQPMQISGDMRFIISINGLGVLVLGLFPSALIDLCRSVF
ncbi:MAG: nuoN [Gammaproteobacteria bacterium]|jgi:NADH-quinone oxidoreductase subunit N|nr:nuoN [Gammaproteobacteria bacterium]